MVGTKIYHTASLWRRVVARILDIMIRMLWYFPVLIQMVQGVWSGGEVAISWSLLITCALASFLYQWFFLYFLGATLGKLLLGLRIVNWRDQADLTLMQACVRVATDGLSFFFGEALHVLALLRFDRRNVSDWVAETWVVQKFPASSQAVPRPVLALVLSLCFGVLGFLNLYEMVQTSVFDSQGIVLTSLW